MHSNDKINFYTTRIIDAGSQLDAIMSAGKPLPAFAVSALLSDIRDLGRVFGSDTAAAEQLALFTEEPQDLHQRNSIRTTILNSDNFTTLDYSVGFTIETFAAFAAKVAAKAFLGAVKVDLTGYPYGVARAQRDLAACLRACPGFEDRTAVRSLSDEAKIFLVCVSDWLKENPRQFGHAIVYRRIEDWVQSGSTLPLRLDVAAGETFCASTHHSVYSVEDVVAARGDDMSVSLVGNAVVVTAGA